MNWRASGLQAWLIQRLTAIYMALFIFFFLGLLTVCPPGTHEEWRATMGGTPMALATTGFFFALFWHAWVGMRDVFIDYIKPFGIRLTILSLVAFSLIIMAFWVVKVLLVGTL